MSRMFRHKRKKALTYLILGIVGVIGLFTIGFQLIINGSVFVANLFGNKSDTTQFENQVLAEIVINDIPSATNSSELKISGNTYNIDTLLIFLNDRQIKKLSISADNEFETLVSGLKDGENEIYFEGEVKDSKTKKKSEIFLISSKTSKPMIEVTSPSDNSTTPQSNINIKGKTDTDVYLRINNLPAVVSSEGNFNQNIQLAEGENKILLLAEDSAGNIVELTLTVIYEK
jgi:hypothetical protein